MGQFQEIGGSFAGNFKKVWGDLSNLLPKGFKIQEAIKFSSEKKVGLSYNPSVILSKEGGATWAGSAGGVVSYNPATSGNIVQADVRSFEIMLPSYIPFASIGRSQNDAQAFAKVTGLSVKNNMYSHQDLLEGALLYGQSSAKLGYVSYATATYRGVSFTNGGGALTVKGSSVTFTAGVNTSSKWILLAPGQNSGLWLGRVGSVVNQCASADNSIVGSGTIEAYDAAMGAIKVSFTPVAATSTTSHYLCWPGWETSGEMIGINKILTNSSSSLFGISASTYELWAGVEHAIGATKLTFARLQDAMAKCANNGLDGDVTVFVNPRSFATLNSDQAALRVYDAKYSPSEGENGFEGLVFHSMAGKMTIVPHRHVKEGEAYGLHIQDWCRPGAQDIAMKVQGSNQELIVEMQDLNCYRYMTYSDSAIFCEAPCKSFIITGINDESAT